MDVNIEFRKVIPITKAWEDGGELYIEGESSGPELDKDEQFMTPKCVEDMSAQVNANPIPVNDEHQKRGILSGLGTAIRSEITPELHMKPTAKLDRDNPASVTLWKKIQKGKQFGFSIAGHVLELAKKTINGKVYKGFNRIRLDHIAVTTKPSWAPSLGTLVAKSLEQAGFDWSDVPEYGGEIFASVEPTRVEEGVELKTETTVKAVEPPEQPKPLVYGEDGDLVKTEPKKEDTMPGAALTSFEQTGVTDVGTLPIVEKGPQPSVGDQVGSGLTSFQQVADDIEERAAKQITSDGQPADLAVAPLGVEASPTRAIGNELLGFVDKVFASDAPLTEKRAALAEVGKSFFNKLGQMLDGERPEEDRLRDAVMRAMAPLVEKIEGLERRLAVAKSQPREDEPDLVRKSLQIGIRPARVVEQEQESPTFVDLVMNPRGGGWASEQ